MQELNNWKTGKTNMKTCIISVLLLAISYGVSGQSVAFTYDADGNMESRYVITLRSSTVTPDGEKETSTEIVSVELGKQKITVYPNPTQGRIYVEISSLNLKEENVIRMFDASGRLHQTKKIVSEHTYLEISGNSGIYLLNIQLGTNVSKWKIIKQ